MTTLIEWPDTEPEPSADDNLYVVACMGDRGREESYPVSIRGKHKDETSERGWFYLGRHRSSSWNVDVVPVFFDWHTAKGVADLVTKMLKDEVTYEVKPFASLKDEDRAAIRRAMS